MQCLDRFNKRMSLSGGTLRSEYIRTTRELLEETFADDPSYTLGIYFWRLCLKEYRNELQLSNLFSSTTLLDFKLIESIT